MGNFQVIVGLGGRFAAARCSIDKANNQKIWLINVFQISDFFANR